MAVALGRTKIGRRQQQANPAAKEQEEAEAPDHELESYLAALNPGEEIETTGTGRRFGASQVYQLRLPLMANERLKEIAARQGTSPDALARDWIMQHLAQEEEAAPSSQSAQPPTPEPEPSPQWPQQETRQVHVPGRARQPGSAGARGSGPDLEETDTEITMPRNYR